MSFVSDAFDYILDLGLKNIFNMVPGGKYIYKIINHFTNQNTAGYDSFPGFDGPVINYTGGVGDDKIGGSKQGDDIAGGLGKDLILAGQGNDKIYGGNRTASPADGSDLIVAGDGDDTVYANGGHDTVLGGRGKDFINGGFGNDIIVGGLDTDRMTGSFGADTYTFTKIDDSYIIMPLATKQYFPVDVITDFNPFEGDRIDLSAIDANLRKSKNNAFKFDDADQIGIGKIKNGHIEIYKDGKDTIVQAWNGNGEQHALTIRLENFLGTLSESDFIL